MKTNLISFVSGLVLMIATPLGLVAGTWGGQTRARAPAPGLRGRRSRFSNLRLTRAFPTITSFRIPR